MTRINLVDPRMLTDKHLLAEYRELPRVFTLINLHLEKHGDFDGLNAPTTYTLGKGHVKFFYNKIVWLRERFRALCEELLNRGVNLDRELCRSILSTSGARNMPRAHRRSINYVPTPEEYYLNMVRIAIRSKSEAVNDEILDAAKSIDPDF